MSRPTLKVVHTSDTHTLEFSDSMPEGDILIHSGDATFDGSIKQTARLEVELSKAASKFKHVIFVPGNHDWFFEDYPHLLPEIENRLPDNVHILISKEISIEGYKFYGHPHTPRFHDWAFNVDRGSRQMVGLIDQIPKDVDVLISHGPPHGILDQEKKCLHKVGCEDLRRKLPHLGSLKLMCFGHIHEEYGNVRLGEVIFSNGSYLSAEYDFNNPNPPHVYELTHDRAEFPD